MKKIGIILFITVAIWMAVSFAAIMGDHTGSSIKPGSYPQIHADNFFDPANFYLGDFTADLKIDSEIKGAVIPHHLLANKLIAEVFHYLQKQRPERVILIAPNHENSGRRFLTSSLGWQTPFGVVEADEKYVGQLTEATGISVNNEICGTEHALGNIMPFIKYYLPEAEVVPIILHQDVSFKETQDLGKVLANTMGKNTVIIAAVDFSHDLPSREAVEKDKETLLVLEENNFDRLFRMGNDYLDSPASIGLLFNAMEENQTNKFTMLRNTNSGVLLNNSMIKTTSYFTLVFTQ